jgi:hypothetical protein
MPAAISRRAALLGAAALSASPAPAAADGTLVDLQLVLAIDTSGSVTRPRFELQRDGYVAAFRTKEVQSVIQRSATGAIAITVTHWTGPFLQRVSIPWTRVGNTASCLALADAIAEGPRQLFAGGTSISGAIDHARQLFYQCPFKGAKGSPPRRVIDVSGDGENNRGRPPHVARDEAVAQDITINGLPILAIESDLDTYYAEHVIGGVGAFQIPAESYEKFADAVRRKLVLEIS